MSVLDLAPISSGSTSGQALRNSIDLAPRLEAAGYHRHWVAEHHFTPGVASAAPAVLIGAIAAATSTIRVGAAAVQTGHQTALSIVEQFGVLEGLFPGRIDLGLGRSGQRRSEALAARAKAKTAAERGEPRPPKPERTARVVDGLLIPKPWDPSALFASAKLKHQMAHLQQEGADAADYDQQVGEVLAFLAGTLTTPEGEALHAVPGEGSDPEVWIFGSTAGQSARVAGARGLRFAANYHVSPGTLLETVHAYQEAFRPSAALDRPHLAVSADVVVADDEAEARRLAAPFGLWVRSIRTGQGAVAYPSEADAAAHAWTEHDRELVADRVDTQIVGTPDQVVAGLETLARVTGADELVVTTITNRHEDRVRSHELLAAAWLADAPVRAGAGGGAA
jgi:alkanesulfonate monooxygenase SsuD/methylene tetrahydromethanopterin reductase-like flavin-dependent oxidoreductase (luciferase family)